VQLKARDAADVERLLALLREAAVRIEDLEIGRADLEDVFLEIMQGVSPSPDGAPPAVNPTAEVAA
jgi:ABC-2 type transport system ATP-binding protein